LPQILAITYEGALNLISKEGPMKESATVLMLTICVLALALTADDIIAQEVLYSLSSPNPEQGGGFGYTVAGAGDVNNDGFPDVIVGASQISGTTASGEGRAYVFSGPDGTLLHTLESPHGTAGYFGNWVSEVGDVNGDDHDDILVGAWREDVGVIEDAGAAYVFSGATWDTLYSLVSPNLEASGWFGCNVSGTGDLNQDGCPDIIVGAGGEGPGGVMAAGRAYVFSGATGDWLRTLVSPHPDMFGFFGFPVTGVGDVDEDGHADLAVGAHQENPPGNPSNSGMVYVFSGATGDTLYGLSPPHEEIDGLFGLGLSNAGDWDADGYPDIVVGARGVSAGGYDDAGKAYVFSGPTGELLNTLLSPNAEPYGHFGGAISDAGDVNSDGNSDVIVMANYEDSGTGIVNAGRAYIYSGADPTDIWELSSPNPEPYGYFGTGISSVGDVDGDGGADVIVGANFESVGDHESAGRAYVFIEFPTGIASIPERPNNLSLQIIGDTNPLFVMTFFRSGRATLWLYELSGRLVAPLWVGDPQPEASITVRPTATRDLQSGVFTAVLAQGKNSVSRKLVIIH
jgi:hypothetical protein